PRATPHQPEALRHQDQPLRARARTPEEAQGSTADQSEATARQPLRQPRSAPELTLTGAAARTRTQQLTPKRPLRGPLRCSSGSGPPRSRSTARTTKPPPLGRGLSCSNRDHFRVPLLVAGAGFEPATFGL